MNPRNPYEPPKPLWSCHDDEDDDDDDEDDGDDEMTMMTTMTMTWEKRPCLRRVLKLCNPAHGGHPLLQQSHHNHHHRHQNHHHHYQDHDHFGFCYLPESWMIIMINPFTGLQRMITFQNICWEGFRVLFKWRSEEFQFQTFSPSNNFHGNVSPITVWARFLKNSRRPDLPPSDNCHLTSPSKYQGHPQLDSGAW